MAQGKIRAVCISEVRGVPKKNVGQANLKAGWGLEADAHGGGWHRQVSLLSYEKTQRFNERGAGVGPGDFGENLLVEGIDFAALPVGTRLGCGDALLEITQIGKECHSHCRIHRRMGDCIMPREGVFARVLRDGAVAVGDVMRVLPAGEQAHRAAVVTVSDKGARGERRDESGPLMAQLLERAGYLVVERLLLPDEEEAIRRALVDLADRRGVALILTSGGTGFSPRDVTPEATLAVAHRNAPGISEAIRAHSMRVTGRAMLSRGVSVLRGGALIVNLPGSPKAVAESLECILPHLGHGIEVLRGAVSDCAAPPRQESAAKGEDG